MPLKFQIQTGQSVKLNTVEEQPQELRNLVFSRVVPNQKRIGLLTDAIRPEFEQLGLLEFENLPDDGTIDWVELSKPLSEDAG